LTLFTPYFIVHQTKGVVQNHGAIIFTTGTGTTLAAGSSTTLDGGAGGMATVILSSPLSGATVRYRVNNGVEQTFTDDQYTLSLYAGLTTIQAWASQDGYADSDTVTISVTVTGTTDVYVDNNTGVDTNPGTQGQPCKTISGAYAKFPNKNNPTNRIVLLSDITREDDGSGALANLVITDTTQLIIDGSAGSLNFDANAQSLRCLSVSGTGTLTLAITGLGFNNGRHTSAGAGIYVDNPNASVTLTDCVISGNNINASAGTTATGAGIHFAGSSLSLEGSTLIEENHITGATTARGAGVYVGRGSLDKTGTASINWNTITGPATGACTLEGAGLYCNTSGSVTLTGGTINNNKITLTGTVPSLSGSGAGAYLRGGARTLENIEVSNNSISSTSVPTSYANGTGIYFYGSEHLALQDTTISLNKGNCAFGYGGGLYVGAGSTVTMTDGTISYNSANIRDTGGPVSMGDGVCIMGSSPNPSKFTLNSGTISFNVSPESGADTNTAFYLFNSDTRLIIGAADVQVDSSNVVYLANNATIVADHFLTADPVAKLQFPNAAATGDPCLTTTNPGVSPPSVNYYKFDVLHDNGDPYCINADGELSEIESVNVTTYDELRTALDYDTTVQNTHVINITTNIFYSGGSSLSVKEDSHVRIHLTSDWEISVNETGVLFDQASLGKSHLLIDGGEHTLTIQYMSDSYRTQPIFDVQQTGASLVLRSVNISETARTSGSVADAPLVSAAGARVTLENFTFNDAPGDNNSRFSAIMLANNSLCHFVSGEISGFNCSEANYGGVAHVDATSRLYVHSGTFNGNTMSGTSSVTNDPGGTVWIATGVIMD